MATVFENIGFDIKSEDDVYRLSDFVLNTGKILPVESGAYACWSDKSGAEIWERVSLDHESKSVSLLNIDPHFNGATVWHMEFAREFSAERDDILDCKAMLKVPESEQFVCARIMGALAANDFSIGNEYDFQISMIPHSVAFFKNEDTMRSALGDDITALGAFSPIGMYSRMLAADDSETVPADILLTGIAAEVLTGSVRYIDAGDTPKGEFLHLCLNTLLGPLDIAVSQENYETETLPELIDGGNIAFVRGILSAKLIKKRQK